MPWPFPIKHPTYMKEKDDLPVSSKDELSTSGETTSDRSRRLGEFKPTNSPLSATDIERRRAEPGKKRKDQWEPRTTNNIDELAPIPEDGSVKE